MTAKKIDITTFLTKYWLAVFTLAVAIVFSIISPAFFSASNLLNILSSACIVGIMGIGLTCIFATGELDFSAGAQVSIACCIIAVVLGKTSMHNYFVGFAIVIAAMVVIALYNSLLHVKIGIPAFIATLGTSYTVNGLAKALTNSQTLNNMSGWPDCFTFLGQGYLFGVIPMPFVCLVIVAIVVLFYTEYTRAGKYLYAVGSNPVACDYIGIDAKKQKVMGFLITTICCGIAGIIQGSQMNVAAPTLGTSMFVPALTTVFFGATFGRVGVFNVPGTIVGAILFALINRGLLMITNELWLKYWVQGGMLLASLVIVVLIKRSAK